MYIYVILLFFFNKIYNRKKQFLFYIHAVQHAHSKRKNKQLAFRQYKTLKFKTFPIYLLDFNVNGCF
nr:hypothetical protein ctg_00056 [Ostreid herpesvirus 1]